MIQEIEKGATRKKLRHQQVEILFVSQNRVVLKLPNGQRIIILPEIDDHSYDDAIAFLEFKEMKDT